MPRGDKTGPMGTGPMTGRGAGFCGGNERPGYMTSPGGGPGWSGSCRMGGLGGRGHGFRHCFKATGLPSWMRFGGITANSQADKLQILKSQADYLSKSLEAVNRRLSAMETNKDASD